MQTPIKIGRADLSLDQIAAVACDGADAALDRRAVPGIRAARELVELIVERDERVYGITTGFGRLKNVKIPAADAVALQSNLLRSHSAGVGAPLPVDVTRAAVLLRAHSLARGNSGVRLELIALLLDMLQAGVTPIVPSQGSVGASGDLAPLAHMSLVLMGEGQAWYRAERLSGGAALRAAGLQPLSLSYKEGLALVNGTQIMTAIGVLTLVRALNICKAADITAAMSLEAFLGTDAAFDERLNALRPHPGQRRVAANLRHLLRGSAVMASHRGCDRVQDPYSFRCVPVVHGSVRDTARFVANTLHIEANSVTDNPIAFPEDGIFISGGNFHGEPVALAVDYLAIALSELGSIAERRIDKLLDGTQGMPPFLTERHGLCSGFMLAQYTAAALVSENKTLSFPASVDSIPTSAGQEDHVSMGTIGARQCAQVLANLENIIAIEALEAAQALDFRAPLRCGQGTAPAHACVREVVSHLDVDRDLSVDIAAVRRRICDGSFVRAVEMEIGEL